MPDKDNNLQKSHDFMIFDLTKALIALGASALVVGILYLLRERFKKAVVSYLPLWEEVLKKKPATILMRSFRRIFSYLLQLLIIILLILSITESGYGKSKKKKVMAILIDTSTSMAAKDVEPSRFLRAIEFAEKLARSMKEKDEALVLEMSDSPRVIHSWTESPEEIIDAVKKMNISMKSNDFISSLKLSAAALEGMDAPEKEIWILSDGAYDPSSQKVRLLTATIDEIKRKGIDIYHHKTGKESSNLAITRFSARQNLKEKLKLSTNIVIDTFQKSRKITETKDNREAECDKINLRILSGENTVFNKTIEKERFGKIITLDMPVPVNRTLEAKISPGKKDCEEDFLLTDNSARITLPEQLQLKILAITEGNTYLKAVLLLSPLWDVEVTGHGHKPSSDKYDVVVADGAAVPGEIKRKGTLYIEPQFEGFPLKTRGSIEAPSFDQYDYKHPALRWTNLYNVNISKALHYEPGKGDKVLAASGEGPLIIEMNEENRRDLVLAFSVQNTDMALRTTWPLLFINMLYYLSGTSLQVSSASNSPQESDIMPRWLPKADHVKKDPEAYRAFPLWLLLILAALLMNMLEWLSFHRRWTV